MDYNHINKYLDKFKEIIFFKEENYILISKVIENYIKIKIDIKFIKIKNTDIYIKASPIILNEIYINKKNILEDLNKLSNTNKFNDIK